jgi:hypothetical protein
VSWRPNATEFTIKCWNHARGNNSYEIFWENSWGEIDEEDPDESTPDEGSHEFDTLADCFTFAEGLLAASVAMAEEVL